MTAESANEGWALEWRRKIEPSDILGAIEMKVVLTRGQGGAIDFAAMTTGVFHNNPHWGGLQPAQSPFSRL